MGNVFNANDIDSLTKQEDENTVGAVSGSTGGLNGAQDEKRVNTDEMDVDEDNNERIADEDLNNEINALHGSTGNVGKATGVKADENMEEEEEEGDEEDGDNNDMNLLQQPDLTRADKTLEELLELLDDQDFTPIIPDAVTDYYLAKNGLTTTNNKIKRLLALATQKFISDIATDAYEYSRIRSNTAIYNSNNPQTRSRALLMATVANAKGDANVGDDGDQDPGANISLGNQNKEKVSLTMEDLSSALDEYGLNVNRPQFYR